MSATEGPTTIREGRPADDAGFQQRFVAFVRAFGLHRPEETPCGAPVAVSDAHTLTTLAEGGPEGLSQSTLVRELKLTKSTVSRLVDQMTDRGWVERRPDPADGRRRLVALTPTGRRLADEIAGRRRERLAHLFDRLPADERASVLAALDTLVEVAREDSPTDP